MKVFNLCCERDHSFEGWFASAEQYESQIQRGLVVCPVCESAVVRKMPAAPHLNFNATRPALSEPPLLPAGSIDAARAGRGSGPPAGEPADAVATARAQAIEALRKLIAESDDVGERFAEEARKIHYQETAPRSIRGIASNDEREALQEEGIQVLTVPWPGTLKDTLQ